MVWGIATYVLGFLLITNSTLHVNWFYGLVLMPFCIKCFSSGHPPNAVPIGPTDMLIWCFIGFFLLSSAMYSPQLLPKVFLYSLCTLALISSIKQLGQNFGAVIQKLLLNLPYVTSCYIFLVGILFFYAATGTQTQLENLFIGVGIDGYGVLSEQGYFRETWSDQIPRLDVGSNDLSNPSIAAAFFGLNALVLFQCRRGETNTAKKLVMSACLVLLLLGIVLTQARTPLVAVMTILTVWAVIDLKQTRDKLLTVLGLLVLSGILFRYLQLVELPFSRLLSLDGGARTGIYAACLNLGSENHFTGAGFQPGAIPYTETNLDYQHCHNVFIDTFRFGGLIGVCLLVAIQLATFWRLWKSPQKLFLLGLQAYSLGCLMTDGGIPIGKPNFHWFLFWLPVALALVTSQKRTDKDAKI